MLNDEIEKNQIFFKKGQTKAKVKLGEPLKPVTLVIN
jgi:hypothetical protein